MKWAPPQATGEGWVSVLALGDVIAVSDETAMLRRLAGSSLSEPGPGQNAPRLDTSPPHPEPIGADVNAVSSSLVTPLGVAARGRHAEMVRLLLAHGATDLAPSWPAKERAFVDAVRAANPIAGAPPAVRGADAAAILAGPAHPALTSTSAGPHHQPHSLGSYNSSTSATTPPPSSTCSHHASSPSPSTRAAPNAAAAASSDNASAALGALSLASAPAPTAPKLCAHCGAIKSATVKLSKCSGCQAVRYCSAACQEDAHWRAGGHKQQFKALRSGGEAGFPWLVQSDKWGEA